MTVEQAAEALHPGFTPGAVLGFDWRTAHLTVVGPEPATHAEVRGVHDAHLVGGQVLPWRHGGTAVLLQWRDSIFSSAFYEVALAPESGGLIRTAKPVEAPSCGWKPKLRLELSHDALSPNGAPVAGLRVRCRAESKMSCGEYGWLVLLSTERRTLRPTQGILMSECNLAKDPNEAYPDCLHECPRGRLDRAVLKVLPGTPPKLEKISRRTGATAIYEWKGGDLRTEDPEPIHSGP